MIDYKTRALDIAAALVDFDKTGEQELLELAIGAARVLLDAQAVDDQARDLLMQHNRAETNAESEELFDQYLAKVRETNDILGIPRVDEVGVQLRLMIGG